ncbi:hypothetical protein MSAN_00061700 [Mycena sanguinolenta]|uniref:Uncharacterized protein n=1 Tax=Mycena sanguinolenta TaxID=230812 RepID=A0A8H6ZHL5_9AGAR|nr:hypothetical protein MSAN_00061700 [Mycena sanguinolenta]
MATSTPLPTLLAHAESVFIYDIVGIVLQTLFFGIYTVVAILSSRMLLKRGLKTLGNRVLFIMTLLVYLLSTAYWVYSFAHMVERTMIFFREHQVPNPSNLTPNDNLTKWSPLFNAIMLVNYIFSDVVVVWRAWILTYAGWENYRKYLCVTIGFLVLSTLSVAGVISFRIVTQIVAPYGQVPQSFNYLVEGINVLQISNLGFSLLSNLSATAVVGATAWRYRRSIRTAFADKKKTTTHQILILMVESGILYCISSLAVLISSFIRLPNGTLGDIFTPINVQIAGAYPSVVLLLVSTQSSLGETFVNTLQVGGSLSPPPTQFGNKEAKSGSIMQFRNPEFSGIETSLGEEGPGSDQLEHSSGMTN